MQRPVLLTYQKRIMVRIILILLLAIPFNIVSGFQYSNDKMVYIEIKDSSLLINDGSKYKLNFEFTNKEGERNNLKLLKVENKVYSATPLTIIQQEDATNCPYILYPGERVEISQDNQGVLHFNNKLDNKRTNDLNFLNEMIHETDIFCPSTRLLNVISLHELKSRATQIEHLKKKRLSFLISYNHSKKMTDEYRKIAHDFIHQFAILDSIYLFSKLKSLERSSSLFKSWERRTFKKIISQKDLNADAANTILVKITETFIYFKLFNTTQPYIKDSSQLHVAFDLIHSSFKNLSRSFLLSRLINLSVQLSIPVKDRYYQNYIQNNFSDRFKVMKVPNSLNAHNFITEFGDEKIVYTDLQTIKSLKSIVEEHKEKVIVFDIWASWCRPCIEQFPFSEKLKEKYKKEDITFIVISIDDDILAWETGNKRHIVDTSKSYLLLDNRNSKFLRYFNIATIPHLIILDKKGNIVSQKAPLPNDSALELLLDKYTKE